MIFPKLPTTMFLKFAIVGLLMAVAYGAGNLHATERAHQRDLQDSADRQRQNHEQLIGWYADKMKELRLAREQQEGADAAARDILATGKADAERAARQAQASLRTALGENSKLTETNDGLRKVNEILADRPTGPGCELPARVREALNTAADAYPADAGDSEAAAAGRTDGDASTSQTVTCEQLARGYAELGGYARAMRAWVLAWQAWANIALR